MLNHSGIAITILKGHELMLYEALSVIVGPFLIFTIVKMLRTIINDQTLKSYLESDQDCFFHMGIW